MSIEDEQTQEQAQEQTQEQAQEQTQGTAFVQATLKVLGGKWKVLILWHLKDEPKRFSQLKRLIPEITEKMLIQQLRELERDAIVSRTVYSESPLRVEYAFTDYGQSLKPVLQALCEWGERHLHRSLTSSLWQEK